MEIVCNIDKIAKTCILIRVESASAVCHDIMLFAATCKTDSNERNLKSLLELLKPPD